MLGELFRNSQLEMSATVVSPSGAVPDWGALLTNRILAVVAIVLVVANLPNFFRVFPDIWDCLRRSRANSMLEHSANLARMRNMTALAGIIPFCLIADRFGLYQPEILGRIDPFWHSLILIGVLVVYVFLRNILFAFFKPRRLHAETEDIIHHCIYSYFCLLVFFMLLTVAVCHVAGSPEDLLRKIMLWETAALFALSVIRTGQILTQHVHGLSTILYLCALELIPAAALVASAIVF